MTESLCSAPLLPRHAPGASFWGSVWTLREPSFRRHAGGPLGLKAWALCCPCPSWLMSSRLGQSRASRLLPREPPPGSPPGGQVLPGPRPRTDHGGERQGRQEGEEAKVEQALEAVVADTSESVQVVLERGGQGTARGLSLSLEAPLPRPGPRQPPLPAPSTLHSH